MICLSGDLHHMSLGTGNQAHCDVTEIQVAQRYLRMLEEAGVRVTFFVSGKSLAEECDHLKPIYESPFVEIGGHNYSCFTPELWHRFWNKAIGSYNGPAWYQRRDALKTANIIRKRTGRQIRCWRNHMYMHGPYTERVLADCGIPICSDGVVRSSIGPTLHKTGTWNFPLNIMPDHEHLYHAERTPEWVDAWVKRYDWSDDYGSRSYYVEEWTDLVLEELQQHENHGVVSNMLIHPITLYLCDRFKSFERILDFLSTHETVTMSDAVDRTTVCQREEQLT
jgi:peptidoglycan/xylan/chitin deacetylase (PgdA/CDA1 family)